MMEFRHSYLLFLLLVFLSAVTIAQVNMQVPAEHERSEGVLLVWDYHPARDSVVANINLT